MRRARAVARADVEVDALFLVVALVLGQREAGMRAVIHPVEAQPDIVIGTRGNRPDGRCYHHGADQKSPESLHPSSPLPCVAGPSAGSSVIGQIGRQAGPAGSYVL